MNELTPKLPQELQETLEHYYTSPTPRTEFASRLEVQLRQRVEQMQAKQDLTERMSFMRLLRTRPVIAILIVLFIMLVLSGVAYALGRSLGYIPGLGLVDQNAQILVLVEPVSQTRDGITVTVEKVIVIDGNAQVVFKVEGLTSDKFSLLEPLNTCFASPELRLATGKSTQMESGTSSPLETGYEGNFVYQSVPTGVDEGTLFVPCIDGALKPGSLPENWSLHFQLLPASPENKITAIPVTQYVPSATPTSTTPIALTMTPEITPISIKSVIDTGDTYILIVDVNHPEPISGYDWNVITLLDGNGNEIDWNQPNDLQLENPDPPFTATWAYQFEKGFVPPITVQYTLKHYVTFQAAPFVFNAGAHPKLGDQWKVNQPMEVNGHAFTLTTVRVATPHSNMGTGVYQFSFVYSPEDAIRVWGIDFEGHEPLPMGGGGGGGDEPSNVQNVGLEFGTLPKGKLNITFTFSELDSEQKWTLPWQP